MEVGWAKVLGAAAVAGEGEAADEALDGQEGWAGPGYLLHRFGGGEKGGKRKEQS